MKHFEPVNHLCSKIDGTQYGNEVFFQKEDLSWGFNLTFNNLKLTSYQTSDPKRIGYVLIELHNHALREQKSKYEAILSEERARLSELLTATSKLVSTIQNCDPSDRLQWLCVWGISQCIQKKIEYMKESQPTEDKSGEKK